eukprot:COSAG05_NODE_1829_length_4002_cov_3.573917_6_plen_74_part_00
MGALSTDILCSLQVINGSFKWAAPSANPAWDESVRFGGPAKIFDGFKVRHPPPPVYIYRYIRPYIIIYILIII